MPNENVILFKYIYIYRIVCNECNFFIYVCVCACVFCFVFPESSR